MTTLAHQCIMDQLHKQHPTIAYALKWFEGTLHDRIEESIDRLETRLRGAQNDANERHVRLRKDVNNLMTDINQFEHLRLQTHERIARLEVAAPVAGDADQLAKLEATVALLSTELEQLKQHLQPQIDKN